MDNKELYTEFCRWADVYWQNWGAEYSSAADYWGYAGRKLVRRYDARQRCRALAPLIDWSALQAEDPYLGIPDWL